MAYNILIVDDSMIIRSVIRRAITLSGVDVGELHEAANGKQALDQLEDSWIDIVFADINMPEMNGIELVDQMAARGMLRETPVVIVSTDRSEVRMRQLRERGVSEYLHKPFTPEIIRDTLERCLAHPGLRKR